MFRLYADAIARASSELDAVILKLLEKHPADRFVDARSTGAAFQRIREALERA